MSMYRTIEPLNPDNQDATDLIFDFADEVDDAATIETKETTQMFRY